MKRILFVFAMFAALSFVVASETTTPSPEEASKEIGVEMSIDEFYTVVEGINAMGEQLNSCSTNVYYNGCRYEHTWSWNYVTGFGSLTLTNWCDGSTSYRNVGASYAASKCLAPPSPY